MLELGNIFALSYFYCILILCMMCKHLYIDTNCIFLFSSGIITAISMFNSTAKGIFIGLLMLFVAIGFLLAAGGDLLLLTKV